MTQKVKVVIGIALFIAIIAGASIAYDILAQQYRPTVELEKRAPVEPDDEPEQVAESEQITEQAPEPDKEDYKAPDFTGKT